MSYLVVLAVTALCLLLVPFSHYSQTIIPNENPLLSTLSVAVDSQRMNDAGTFSATRPVTDVISALEEKGWTRPEIIEALKSMNGKASDGSGVGVGGGGGGGGSGGGGVVSWLLNTALPAAIVVGTGVAAVYLTGGKDELPLGDGEGFMMGTATSTDAPSSSSSSSSHGGGGGVPSENRVGNGVHGMLAQPFVNERQRHASHEDDDYDDVDYDEDYDTDGSRKHAQYARGSDETPEWVTEVRALRGEKV